MLVSTDDMVLYADKNYFHKKKNISSPAIVIEQRANGYRLLQANGQIAWARNIAHFNQAFIKAERLPVDGTSHPRAFSEKSDFHWMSVTRAQKGTLEAVTVERHESTPYYVKQEGRMLGLYPWQHPYIWPEMWVKFEDKQLWVDFSDIEINSPVKVKAQGIIISQFIPVVKHNENFDVPEKVVALSKNLSDSKYKPIKLYNISWKIESIILPEATAKSDLESIGFYSSNKNSYLFSLQWKNGVTQYIGYTGLLEDGSYGRIATPVLLSFYLKDKNTDGKMDWHLQIANVRPDEVIIERLDINGAYSDTGPVVDVVVLGWN